MVWCSMAARPWMSRASPEEPLPLEAQPGTDLAAACSSSRPRWCWSAPGWRRKRPWPGCIALRPSRPRRARRRSRQPRRPDSGRFQACGAAAGPWATFVFWWQVGHQGCGPGVWPPRPRVMAAGRACRARAVAGTPFSTGAFQLRLAVLVVACPCCPWPGHAPPPITVGRAGARSVLLCSAVAIAIEIASRLQTRSVRQKPAPSTQGLGREGDARGAGAEIWIRYASRKEG